MRVSLWGALAALAALSAGCVSSTRYEQSADRDIDDILRSARYEAVDRWQKNARLPKTLPPEKTKAVSPGVAPPAERVRVLSLRTAMRLATTQNREFKTELESLRLTALALSGRRRDFGPILSNTLECVYSNSPSSSATGTFSAEVGVSKILPSGGTVSAAAGASLANDYEGGGTTYSHDVTLSFEQPLLKGAGREVAYEALTQAERDVAYALREFELFRQDFVLRTLRKYYGILRQKQVVENSRRTYEQFRFLRKRSEELFRIGKVTAVDKFRAAQEELSASNDLITEQETLEALLDDFKVFLGLPVTVRIDVEDTEPVMRPTRIDLRSALDAALHNRLDLQTARERVRDAERAVRNARNGLLPDLDLKASVTAAGSNTGGFGTSSEGAHSVGLTLSLPWDKVPERNTYLRALITLRRRTREFALARDRVRVQVMNTYRNLRRLANSVRIHRANVAMAEKRLRNARLRFEAGTLGNRDVVEAQSAKLAAQNALIRAILDYEIARLQLKRDIGILFIDRDGMWKE